MVLTGSETCRVLRLTVKHVPFLLKCDRSEQPDRCFHTAGGLQVEMILLGLDVPHAAFRLLEASWKLLGNIMVKGGNVLYANIVDFCHNPQRRKKEIKLKQKMIKRNWETSFSAGKKS